MPDWAEAMLEQHKVALYLDLYADKSITLLDLDWIMTCHTNHEQREYARKALVVLSVWDTLRYPA